MLFIQYQLLCLINLKAMGQNKHPMRISMVSVFVEDPVKAFKYYTEVLGFEELMYSPENYIAIVRSALDRNGTSLMLEPTGPGGIEIAQTYKKQLYDMGIPVISLSSDDISLTVEELKAKGVIFKKELTNTDWGQEAIFDDSNGNYIQLIQVS